MTTAPPPGLAAPPTSVRLTRVGLLRAEFRRLRLRRLLVWTVIAYLGLLVLALGAAYLSYSADDGAGRAAAAVSYERNLASCRANPEDYGPPLEQTGGEQIPCEQLVGPVEAYFSDPRFFVGRELPDVLLALAGTFAVVAFVLGASAIGAEWSARTLPALLVREPRRARVLLTKLLALLVAVAAVAALVQALGLAFGLLTGATRGTFEDVPSIAGFWPRLMLQAGRGVALGVLAAALGFAVAAAARSTAAALGAAFGYFALGEIALRGFRPQWDPWLFTSNAVAWVRRDGYTMRIFRPEVNQDSGYSGPDPFYDIHLTNADGALYLALVTAVLLAAAHLLFRRRDLT